jgi:hypothetical protein
MTTTELPAKRLLDDDCNDHVDPPSTSRTHQKLHLLLHCVDGCVPYLNPSQLEKYFPPSPSSTLWLGLAVRDTSVTPVFEKKHHNKKTNAGEMNEQPKKVRGYTFTSTRPDPWLLPYTRVTVPSFYGTEDNNNEKKQKSPYTSSNSNKAIHVWTPHGRQKLTPELYATAALDGLQSHFTLSLCDNETTKGEGDDYEDGQKENPIKRKAKANQRNEQWFNQLMKMSKETKYTDTTHSHTFWKPILLPNMDDEDDNNFMNTNIETCDENNDVVSGFAFVGQWRPGLKLKQITQHIQYKAILSTPTIREILEIAAEGYINVIGTALPTIWAKEKLAWGVNLLSWDNKNNNNSSSSDNTGSMKRQKTTDPNNDGATKTLLLDSNGCMDISDKSYARDSRPLVVGCSCMACNKECCFSRAYIHHLVCAKELLAEILLFGHNLHHLLNLINLFNKSNDPSQLKEYIEAQLPFYQID